MRNPFAPLLFIVGCSCLGATIYILCAQYGNVALGVDRFHERYNESKYSDIWKDGSNKLRESFFNEQRFVSYLQTIHQRLGKVKASSKISRQEIDRNTTPRKVEVVQTTVFENGERIEIFTFEIVMMKTSLTGYRIELKGAVPN